MEKVYKFCQISEIKYLSLNTDRYIPKSEHSTELLSTNHVWFSCITGCEVVSE